MKFKVGDGIRMVGEYDGVANGTVGVIRGLIIPQGNSRYAVEFNSYDINGNGHTCDGIVSSCNGLWIPEDFMDLLDNPTPVPTYPPVSTASPIMRFESQQQLEESLAEWQSKLLLSDWLIKVKLVRPEELVKKGGHPAGFNNYESFQMVSEIVIADEDRKDTIAKTCAEKVLIHELLHLKLPRFASDGSIESCLYNDGVHATIEQLAKSLLMAKYNLSLSWFKNF